ncbi:MBL fold hydrolase [soil metagenome]
MSDVDVVPVPDPGLGNHSYVIGLGDGSAAVIDPVRDPAAYLELAEARGWQIRCAVETHLHADFLSGSRELAGYGAGVVLPAASHVAFPATGLEDGGQLDLAGLTLEAIATPGHTPEHLAYLLRDGSTPLALFSGGALIPGGVARPDLLGPAHTRPLAGAAYRSLRDRLLRLPDDLPVHPTHGAGSFCSTGAGAGGSTTIGAERAHNQLLAAGDEDDFVDRLLGSLGSYPPYFLELRDVNRAGPAVLGPQPPPLTALSPAEVAAQVADGAELVDVRAIDAFAQAHVPGSLSIPLREQFAVWLGWLVDRRRPVVFVADAATDRVELVRECLKIGYERMAGELSSGMDGWRAAGRPTAGIPLVTPDAAGSDRVVLDVRQHAEWDGGHLPDATHLELGALPAHLDRLRERPLLVHCGHGERAMTAASLLERAGHRDVVVLAGSADELAGTRGDRLVPGG